MSMKKIAALLMALVLCILCGSALAKTYPTLTVGDKGTQVRTLQTALNKLGYDVGTVDGKFGEGTRKAVIAFQRDNGLKQDGKAGNATQTLLYSKSAKATATPKAKATATPKPAGKKYFGGDYTRIEYGDQGARVSLLQQALKKLGYYKSTADGKFYAGTRTAVKDFQKANGLTADGVAGKKTL